MYTQLVGTVASAVDMAGSVSGSATACDRVFPDPLAHLMPAVFPRPAVALPRRISNDFVDPPGI